MNRMVLLLFGLFWMVSCTPSDSPSPATSSEKGQTLPLLLLGSGGGFTGAWTGLGVASDGQVFSWQGSYPDSIIQTPLKKLSSEELSRLNDLLSQLPTQLNEPGNFSFSIKTQHKEWIWNPQSNSEQELSIWFETITTFIDNNQEYVK